MDPSASADKPSANDALDDEVTPASLASDRSAALRESLGLKDALLAVALVIAVFVVYQPAWQGSPLWDDDGHMTRPELQSWHGLCRIWFELGATQQYYPLLCSAFWIEHKLWGDATLGYHLVNIVLHALAALMVALILRRLAIPGAYLAAAIFALHPVCVESVAWISEQKNTLSAVFYLGAAWAYFRFDETRKTGPYLVALGLFVLGLLSKTVTATLPGALLVIFWWQRGRLSWKKDVWPLMPFFVVGAVAGMFTAWVERKLIGAEGAAFELTMLDRLLLAGRVIWFYLGKLCWPSGLLFIYPRWHVSSTVWWQYLFPLAALLLLAAAWALWRRCRGPLAGLLFFVGTLFPVLGFCNVFPFLYSFVADHFQYLASLGVITLAAAGAALLLDRWRLSHRPAGYLSCVAVLAVLACLTWRQSRMYADAETLYRMTIQRNPACWMAHNNLGSLQLASGQIDEAMAQFQRTLEIKPDFAEPYYNLGVALARRGQLADAIAHYRKALAIKPNFPEAHADLATTLAEQGQVVEAMTHFQRAVELMPGSGTFRYNFGVALYRQGKIADAVNQWREAAWLMPNQVVVLNQLAWVLATCPEASIRNGEEAVALAERAVQLSEGRDPAILGTLAAAYAETGRFSRAIQATERAAALASAGGDMALADVLRARVKLYQASLPYHETLDQRRP